MVGSLLTMIAAIDLRTAVCVFVASLLLLRSFTAGRSECSVLRHHSFI